MNLRASLCLALVPALMVLGACRAMADHPAVVIDPGPTAHAELAAVLSRAMGGMPVTLAPDAFTRSDVLILERRRHPDLQGRRGSGRERAMPEQFRLVAHGSRCFVVRVSTGTRYALAHVHCAAIVHGR